MQDLLLTNACQAYVYRVTQRASNLDCSACTKEKENGRQEREQEQQEDQRNEKGSFESKANQEYRRS
jgi:hypothetical protein